MLRGAFIGFGNVAEKTHMPGYASSGFQIVAAVEPAPARRQAAEKAGLRAYASTAELWKNERLDFVDICTPPAGHAAPIREALDHGVHVLCEKPLVLALGELASLKGERVVYGVHNWKFSPQFIRIRELTNEIGALRRFTWRTERLSNDRGAVPDSTNWRIDPKLSGGGILFDHGWHAMYLAISTLRQEPRQVQVREFVLAGEPPIESQVSYTLRFDSAEADIVLSWAAARRYNGGTVEGDRGTIRLEDSTLDVGGRRIDFPEALSFRSSHPDWFGPVLADFRREIEDPAVRGAGLREASWCLRSILAAYESARSSSKVVTIA